MAKTIQVRCPRCGRPQNGTGRADTIYYCAPCRAQFDNDPDEGGDYSDRSPAARLEREERNRGNKRRGA